MNKHPSEATIMQDALADFPLIPSLWQLFQHWIDALPDSAPLPPPAGLGFEHHGGHRYHLSVDRLDVVCEHRRQRYFPKIHLEATLIGEGFAYVHGMLFPDPGSGLPLLGVDVNASPRQVSLAVLHAYPSVGGLPEAYSQAVTALDPDFSRYRPLPQWGDIFQEGICLLIQPQDAIEAERYLAFVSALLDAHQAALKAIAWGQDVSANVARQHYYCQQKRRNDRGRKVLAKHLGIEVADRYVDDFLWPLL